jgi:hypothetical protein
MKTIRQISRDRWLGGGIALALVYLIMLQSMLASVAQGTLAGANAGQLQIICAAGGITAVKHAPAGDIPDHEALHWHCAALCQVSSAGTPAVLGAQAGFISAPQAAAPVVFLASAEILRPSFQRLIAEARAPPPSI